MSLTLTTESSLRTQASLQKGNLTVPQFSFLALLATLAAIAADQFAAPALYSSSPLWAVIACLALVWRRGGAGFGLGSDAGAAPSRLPFDQTTGTLTFSFSTARVLLFVAAHCLLLFTALFLGNTFHSVVGTLSFAGWIAAALKLAVLLPTLLLLPLKHWRALASAYTSEGIAALVVLLTFFPGRFVLAAWPWYGQGLGRVVFLVSSLFVPGLALTHEWTPTILGPHLDVTVLLACSGLSGIELFDCLFGLIVFLDWNRLRKGRLLGGYFLGISAMLAGNALRIAFLVVLGNRGFVDAVLRFHISAGWIFFSIVFLAYLLVTYRWLLKPSLAKAS